MMSEPGGIRHNSLPSGLTTTAAGKTGAKGSSFKGGLSSSTITGIDDVVGGGVDKGGGGKVKRVGSSVVGDGFERGSFIDGVVVVDGGGKGGGEGDGGGGVEVGGSSPPMSVASVPVGMGGGGMGGSGVIGGIGGGVSALREDLGFGELRGPAKVRVKRGVRERTRGLFAGLRRDSNAGEMGRRRMPVMGGRVGVGGGDTGSVGGGASVAGSVDDVGGGGKRKKKGSTLGKEGGSAGGKGVGEGGGRGIIRNKTKQDLKKREKHLQRRNHKVDKRGDRLELHKIDDVNYATPWQATEQLAAEIRELRAKIEEVRMTGNVDPNASVASNVGGGQQRRVSVPTTIMASSSLPPSPMPSRRRSSEDGALLDPSKASPRKRATLEATALATRAKAAGSSATRTQSMAASLTISSTTTTTEKDNGEGGGESDDGELGVLNTELVAANNRLARLPRDRSRRNIDIEMLRLRFEAEGGALSKEHIIQLILDMRAERENNRELRELVATQRAKMESISRGRDELEAERDVLGDRVRELESRRSEEESLKNRVKLLERENERLRKQVESDKKLRRSKGRANVEVVVESLKAELAASKARLHAEVAEGERLRKRLSMYEGSNGDLQLD